MPQTALSELQAILLPEAQPGDRLGLVVHTDCCDLPIRDMAAYLQLIDNVYGRLQPTGFRSYVMRPAEYLRVHEVRAGSLELVISEILQAGPPIVVVWLCLKYLPPAAESLAKAFDGVQQGLLAREKRKQIRQQMERDEELAGLPEQSRNDLAALAEAVFEKDHALIARAFRFSEEPTGGDCSNPSTMVTRMAPPNRRQNHGTFAMVHRAEARSTHARPA